METRLYFIVGDLIANIVTGALVGAACALIFGPAWNMWLAMLVGMIVGMAIALPLFLLLGALFGAMEVMIPTMLTAMVVSMVIPMAAAMTPISVAGAAQQGAWYGVGTLAMCYAANAIIRTRASRWTK